MNEWRALAYAEAVKDAQHLLAEVGSEQTEPIDVVRVVAHLGLTISFGSFRALSGAYLPGDAEVPPMVIVNVAHPFTRQRFTVGHEIAHHLQHAGPVSDVETEALARGEAIPTQREFYAEAFAASLLMPRRLVRALEEEAELKVSEVSEGGIKGQRRATSLRSHRMKSDGV